MPLYDVNWKPVEEGRETIRMGVRIVEGQLRVLGSYPMSLGPYMSQNDRFMGDPTGYLLPSEGDVAKLVERAIQDGLRGVEVFWASSPDDPSSRLGTLTMFDRMSG